jgi:hypothetical protein
VITGHPSNYLGTKTACHQADPVGNVGHLWFSCEPAQRQAWYRFVRYSCSAFRDVLRSTRYQLGPIELCAPCYYCLLLVPHRFSACCSLASYYTLLSNSLISLDWSLCTHLNHIRSLATSKRKMASGLISGSKARHYVRLSCRRLAKPRKVLGTIFS